MQSVFPIKNQFHLGPGAVRLILAMVIPAMGCLAILLGQDASWDLRNYHFYNPFAYLTGRMGYDIAAAQVATFYNPLMHLPFYFAVTTLPPKVVAFSLGCIHGCNIFFLYAIAGRVIHLRNDSWNRWICLVTAMVGILGATNLAEIGTSYGDNLLSIPVLASIYLIMDRFEQLRGPGPCGIGIALIAGLTTGATVGLKQPFAVYAVGLCAAFFGISLPLKRRFQLAFFFGLGVLAGIALTGGFWLLEMWERYRNPLFPYFNQVFRSPWGAPESYRDVRFIPTGTTMWLLFPFRINLNPFQVGEVSFCDLRISILYLTLIALLIKRLVSWGRRTDNTPHGERLSKSRFIIIFITVSFLLWMKLFAVYRYSIVCEFMAPLTILLVLGIIIGRERLHMRLTLGCFLLILVMLEPGNWGRRPFASDYFGVHPPNIQSPSSTLVLTAGHDPMAYMIPFFPPEVRFLRIQSYLTGPSEHPNDLDRLMRAIVRDHPGPIFLIYRSYEEEETRIALEAYGLEINKQRCRTFTPHVEPQQEYPFYFCPVVKKETDDGLPSGSSG